MGENEIWNSQKNSRKIGVIVKMGHYSMEVKNVISEVRLTWVKILILELTLWPWACHLTLQISGSIST